MGLAIEVGYLADMLSGDEEGAQWFRDEIAKVNVHLRANGLAAHIEPESCPIFSGEMFGYSGLHYLRRIAAHLNLRGTLPEPGGEDAAKDPVLQEYYKLIGGPQPSLLGRWFGNKPKAREYDHLINHSDAEGFYVPQDFADVLFTIEEPEVAGGMIGSSQRLLREVTRLAQALELPLGLDSEAPEVWEAADSQGEGELRWQRYGVESFTCLRLLRAAEQSIARSALIVFT